MFDESLGKIRVLLSRQFPSALGPDWLARFVSVLRAARPPEENKIMLARPRVLGGLLLGPIIARAA